MALDAGVDDVNHMAVDSISDGLIARMVDRGMAWVPTLELWNGVSRRYGLSWDRIAARNLLRFVEAGGILEPVGLVFNKLTLVSPDTETLAQAAPPTTPLGSTPSAKAPSSTCAWC